MKDLNIYYDVKKNRSIKGLMLEVILEFDGNTYVEYFSKYALEELISKVQLILNSDEDDYDKEWIDEM